MEKLFRILDRKRKELELSWREVSRQTDIAPSTFTRLSEGCVPDIANFTKLVKWAGADANKILGVTPDKKCRHFVLERVNAKGQYACNVCGEVINIQ